MKKLKHIFILNENAGNGRKIKSLRKNIVRTAKESGIDYEIFDCKSFYDAEAAVEQYKDCNEIIRFYACGGDGTLSVTANLIKNIPNTELAVVPVGSGNDFTRSFTGQENFIDIKKQISGTTFEIDTVSCNGKLCVNLLNTGFDSQVVAETEKIRKSGIFTGKLAYVLGILKCLFYMPCVKLNLKTAEGLEIEEDCLLLAIANASYYGGGFMAAPDALLCDGLADVLIVKKVSRRKFVSLVSKYKKGKLYGIKDFDKIAKFVKTSRLTLASEKPFLLSSDGELEYVNNAEISVIPTSLKFVLPSGSFPINTASEKPKNGTFTN